jgi:hypothetical protein
MEVLRGSIFKNLKKSYDLLKREALYNISIAFGKQLFDVLPIQDGLKLGHVSSSLPFPLLQNMPLGTSKKIRRLGINNKDASMEIHLKINV